MRCATCSALCFCLGWEEIFGEQDEVNWRGRINIGPVVVG